MIDQSNAIVLYKHEKQPDNTISDSVVKFDTGRNKIDPKDPKLLDTIARKYGCKIAGEEKTIKTLVCAFVSKDLPKKHRISVIIANRSSTGKSHVLNNVLAPFKDDTIDFTDFTEAFFKRAFSQVDGKIIKIEQLERTNEENQISIQRIKHLLTEGVIRFGVVDRNEKNVNSPKEFTVKGFPVLVTTSTKFDIDPETANRVFMIQLDESEKQTEIVIKHTLGNYSKMDPDKEWEYNKKDLEDFFKGIKDMAIHVEGIVIPFADKIEDLLPKRLEIRRDLPKILSLTCVLAFIRSSNRPQILHKAGKTFIKDAFTCEKESTYTVIALPEDFYDALEIAGETIKQTINKSSRVLMEFYDNVKNLWDSKTEIDSSGQSKYLTVKEISIKTGYSPNRARELLQSLLEGGFVTCDDSMREHKYYVIPDKKFQDIRRGIITFTQEDLEKWAKENMVTNSESYSIVGSWKGIPTSK